MTIHLHDINPVRIYDKFRYSNNWKIQMDWDSKVYMQTVQKFHPFM